MDEVTQEYIKKHLNDDVNMLALSKFPENINRQFVIRQIQARRLLKKKLPSWAENEEIIFPRRLSLEQCSSELTARYKSLLTTNLHKSTYTTICDNLCQSVVERKKIIDLTGGMGVDTSFLSDNFEETFYVESQEELCDLARHNFKILNKSIKVVNAKAEDFLTQCDEVDCIYLDPARRDEYGRKMVSLHDCSPDVAELQDLLFAKAKTIIVKLSPMLDIDVVKKELKNIKEIHVVSVKNECKELLVVCQQTSDLRQQTSCIDKLIAHNSQLIAIDLHEHWNFTFTENEEQEAISTFADEIEKYLYEPGVACMKAAPFKLLSQKFNIKKIHRNSHLYTSDEIVPDFPGRIFEVVDVVPFDKKAKKKLLNLSDSQILRFSISVRNFPLSAEELKKYLGLKDGDDFYIFGTTMKGEKKIVVLCRKVIV